jgi:antitoxin VapB
MNTGTLVAGPLPPKTRFPFFCPTADQSAGCRTIGKMVQKAEIGIYWCICQLTFPHPEEHMQRKAKVFMNNRSQAVRLPKEFQFRTQEVFIRKEGSEVVLSPRPFDWTSYLTEGPVASATFMEGIEDLPMQEREA